MTQQIRANQLNEDIPYLHRTPFIVLWLASYGLAWFLLLLLYDVIRFTDISSPFASVTSWYKTSPGWMNGLVTGLIYGVALSTIQTWILHQRYGQPPRHWRVATIIGSVIAGLCFPMISFSYEFSHNANWLSVALWFFLPSLFQAFALYRISQYWWMMAWVGMIAGMTAMDITIFQIGPTDGLDNACIIGMVIQIIGSCTVILRLLPSPQRVDETSSPEKKKNALAHVRKRFHPIVFVSLWILSYFMGWLVIYLAYFGAIHFGIQDEIPNYLAEIHSEWILPLFAGLTIGFVAAVSQRWLIYKQSEQQLSLWIPMTVIVYGILGYQVFPYFGYNQYLNQEATTVLLAWFALPNLIQVWLLNKKFKGAWIWSLTGIVSGLVAVLISTDIGWRQANALSGAIFGGLVLAIISATTFLFLLSQQNSLQARNRTLKNLT